MTFITSGYWRVVFAALLGIIIMPVYADNSFSPYVDEKGNISLADNFRATMAHLGSWFVPEGDASGFHDVYTEKGWD